MKEKIRAIVKRVGEEPIESTLSNTLQALQATVQGYIEVVGIRPGLIMLVNEEGLIREDITYNCHVNTEIGIIMVYGHLLFLGVENGEDGDEFGDCPATLEEIKDLIVKEMIL